MNTNSLTLKITLKGKNDLEDMIDPISFQLIDWGLEPDSIQWTIDEDSANFELTITDNDSTYDKFSISYNGLNSIMDICYEYYFELSQINIVDNVISTTTFISDYNDVSFITKNN